MALTEAILRAGLAGVPGALSGNRVASLADIAAGADAAMLAAGIKTREGAAIFVAECCFESAYFRTTTEYAHPVGSAGWKNTQRYAPYIGRGFIQVTWRSNYASLGKWLVARNLLKDPDYFVKNPPRLADIQWAWLGAVWYFQNWFAYKGKSYPLYEIANMGDVHAVSGAINAGRTTFTAYGDADRTRLYRALLAGGIQPPKQEGKDWLDMVSQKELEASVEKVVARVVKSQVEGAVADLVKRIPAHVWAYNVPLSKHTISETGTANKVISARGLLQYGLISAFRDPATGKQVNDATKKILDAVQADDKAV